MTSSEPAPTAEGKGEPCANPARKGVRQISGREKDALRRLLGSRVAAARREVGISQRALAAMQDRSPSWVREIETGEQWAPVYLVTAMAEATGWAIGWFYGGHGAWPITTPAIEDEDDLFDMTGTTARRLPSQPLAERKVGGLIADRILALVDEAKQAEGLDSPTGWTHLREAALRGLAVALAEQVVQGD